MAAKKEQLRALLAVRISRLTDSTTSPDRQREATTREAEFRNARVVGVAEDLNISASQKDKSSDKGSPFLRPDLGPWLTDPAKIDQYDMIVWHRLDRAVRSMNWLHALARWAKEHRKRLIFAEGPGGSSMELNMADPVAELIVTILAFAAEMETTATRERITGAQEFLRRVGRWRGGSVPYGLRPVPVDPDDAKKGWTLDHDPVTVQHVLKMVKMVVDERQSLLAVAHDLQKQSVPTPRDHQDACTGRERTDDGGAVKRRKWSQTAVNGILRSRVLLGESVHGGAVVRDGEGNPVKRSAPIISEARWAELQAALDKRSVTRTQERRASLLLDVLHCANCGMKLFRQTSVIRQKGKSYQYLYFRCLGNSLQGNGCTERFRAEAIEQQFVELFLDRVGHLEVERKEFVPGSDNSEELSMVNRTIEELEDEWDAGLLPDRDRYLARKKRLLDRRAKVAEQPVRPAGYALKGTGETYADYWSRADVRERRQMLLDAEVSAYAGRVGAFRAGDEALVEFAWGDELESLADMFVGYAEAGPDALGKDLRMIMFWRGSLADRLQQNPR